MNGRQALLRFCRRTSVGGAPSSTAARVTNDLVDVLRRRDLEHDRAEDVLEDRSETTRARLARNSEVGDRAKCVFLELEFDTVQLEHALVLLHEGVLRTREDLDERGLVER